jgi:hypothetical protein
MDKGAVDKAWAKIVVKAWTDEGFKQRLLKDPTGVIKAEGIEIPKNLTIKIVEGKPNEEVLFLPAAPPDTGKIEKVEERLAAWSIFYQ